MTADIMNKLEYPRLIAVPLISSNVTFATHQDDLPQRKFCWTGTICIKISFNKQGKVMNKILSILPSIFILSLFVLSSANVQAEDIRLQEAIKQTEAVVLATDVKVMTQLAQEAKEYVIGVKSTDPKNEYLQEGLKHLDDIIKESQADKAAAARKAAIAALGEFNQIENKCKLK